MPVNIDPAYLRRNHRSLSRIGGVYNHIADHLYLTHKEIMSIEHPHGSLPFKLLSDTAMLPSKAYPDDAGYDLFTSARTVIETGETADVPTGVALEFPQGVWGMIVGRSSTLRRRKLLVNTGIIDTGWRGELYVNVANLSGHPVVVEQGERLGQMILMQNVAEFLTPIIVEELNVHPRGEKGFGSSGF